MKRALAILVVTIVVLGLLASGISCDKRVDVTATPTPQLTHTPTPTPSFTPIPTPVPTPTPTPKHTPTPTPRDPQVLIDLSHEFRFSTDAWIMNGYLLPLGYNPEHDFSTLDPEKLKRFDTVIIGQTSVNVPFTEAQISGLREFVRRGGGLFIMGQGATWSQIFPGIPIDSYPLNQLLREFGVSFSNIAAVPPFVVHQHQLTQRVMQYVTECWSVGTLTADEPYDILVTDSVGHPVILVKGYGSGTVVAIADECVVSNPFTGEPCYNRELIIDIFDKLVEKRIAETTNPFGVRTDPENIEIVGETQVFYPSILGDRVNFVVNIVPQIDEELDRIVGVEPLRSMKILLLATSGSGFSSWGQAGVGAFSPDFDLVSILAHEMASSWGEPGSTPPWTEAWGFMISLRASEALGYESEVSQRYEYWDQVFRTYDPTGTALDFSRFPEGPAGNQPYFGKLIWVTETLEEQYNSRLLEWVVRYKRGYQAPFYKSSWALSTQETILFLSLAASTDLFPFFSEIGTTVEPKAIELTQTFDENGYHFETISNSIIPNLSFDPLEMKLRLEVTGPPGSPGWTILRIPSGLVSPDLQVQLDGLEIPSEIVSGGDYADIRFNYEHDGESHIVEIFL